MAFQQSVRSSRWSTRLIVAGSAVGAAGAAVLIAVGAMLALVILVFGTLRIRARESAPRVERYRPLTYGGWGVRIGRSGGRRSRAYAAPFLRSAVRIDTRAGRRSHVTSRRPAELVDAVDRLVAETEGS